MNVQQMRQAIIDDVRLALPDHMIQPLHAHVKQLLRNHEAQSVQDTLRDRPHIRQKRNRSKKEDKRRHRNWRTDEYKGTY